MNALNHAIKEALNAAGNNKEANKAYLEFIKANFIIPIEKNSDENQPKVLFLEDGEHVFLPVFSEMSYLDAWAVDIATDINLLKLSGVDLLKGLGENVTVCLNIGSDIYKEFNPSETARMRSMVLKFFKD
ncbi:SseB family protein [Legionella sp. PATHC038]|uniref:SseB family protein n=1 Tax=Legionella sheltonii TaxID=2992041 RepID=UPI00224382F5|nr:SseB family protein [Legionella sp. PATHC038]MCW8398512.1 SseB family protein [Legionella sp. PATHC038]